MILYQIMRKSTESKISNTIIRTENLFCMGYSPSFLAYLHTKRAQANADLGQIQGTFLMERLRRECIRVLYKQRNVNWF